MRPAPCAYFSERNDVEGPHTRINAMCNRWCTLLPFLSSTHARTNKQTNKNTHTHAKNTRFLNIFTFFLGGMMIKAVHWGYPTVVTTTSNYRSPGSGKWHMDKCAMRLASPPEQVDGSEDAFKNIFNFVLFCFVFSNKQNVP